ncbi:proteasome maturation protein-like isoform X2 [Pomacea canaliculata]|uniref:proteasome maturation protein-like isoform X1 n=1 Tax=Pomacea canaliculata TaxID=400727 RepID=UPI000D729595|nr:proteasome maturation protein-like isoform X1 [Pomacea canaliculata]XP_025087420.1 proteasome maturation protein-like isoform X2 [Pomacea canaliculata]
MSLGYPSLRPQPEGSKIIRVPDGPYGAPNLMLNGLNNAHAGRDLVSSHPLEHSEKNWFAHQQQMDMVMLRNSQGIHAPLRLHMEQHMARKIQRLPGLHSSNAMLDTLTGRDEVLGFEDILNDPADAELVGQPHILVEKQLGLL